jgi:hypothetical protein
MEGVPRRWRRAAATVERVKRPRRQWWAVGTGEEGLGPSAMTIAGGDSDGGSEEEGEETTAGSGGCNFVVLGVQNIISFVFFSLNYV